MSLLKLFPNLNLFYKNFRLFSKYVPHSIHASESDIEALNEFIDKAKSLVVLTGAGISTESGIPDYRSEKVGLYARNGHKPTSYQDFLKNPLSRRRYWARSFIAWPTFSKVQPNFNHELMKSWEDRGILEWIVTQNVDSLHLKAGNKNVVELHGALARVICLGCGQREHREVLQERLTHLNMGWETTQKTYEARPDGDVALDDHFVYDFQVPSCVNCGGMLKPDVVLFGENVPKRVLDHTLNLFQQAHSVLVLGSSLYVYSGFRFILKSREQGKKIALVNIGETRADSVVDLKVDAKCSDVLKRLQV